MAVATYSLLQNTLKHVYEGMTHESLNYKNRLMRMFPTEYDKDGLDITQLHHLGGSGSMGYLADQDQLFTPGVQTFGQSIITSRSFWATLSVEPKLVEQSRTNVGAFEKGLDSHMTRLMRDVMRRKEMVFTGAGDGLVGRIASVTATTITFNPSTANSYWQAARRCPIGSQLIFYAPTGTAQDFTSATVRAPGSGSNIVTVTGVTVSTAGVATVTFTASADPTGWTSAVAAGDYCYWAGSRSASASNTALGLELIVNSQGEWGTGGSDTGTLFQGLAVSSAEWQAKTIAAASSGTGPITTTLLTKAMDAVQIGTGEDIDMFVSSYGGRLAYAVDQLNVRRNVNTNAIAGMTAGGFKENRDAEKSVEFGSVVFVPARFLTPNLILGVQRDKICKYYWKKEGWWDYDGRVVRQSTDNLGNITAQLFGLDNNVAKERNTHVRITNVAEDEAIAL